MPVVLRGEKMKKMQWPLLYGAFMALCIQCLSAQTGADDAKADANSTTVEVDLRAATNVTTAERPKLSPILIAVKESNGELVGTTRQGKPIIKLPSNFVAELQRHPQVRTIRKYDSKIKTKPVRMIKIDYTTKPSRTELDELGLAEIEDHPDLKYMTVILKNRSAKINATLAARLAKMSKAVSIAPLPKAQAVPKEKSSIKPKPTNNKRQLNTGDRTPATNDKLLKLLWGMNNCQATSVWGKLHESKTIVAVIDTGVDYNHPDLAANMWRSSKGKCGIDFVDNDQEPMDGAGHGTHCAGIIGAVGNNNQGVVGVNWKVKIMACRWLDADGEGTIDNAVKCIDFAVENGAKILNVSWYWYEDDYTLQKAIIKAKEKGVIVVAAASNFRQQDDNNKGDNDKDSTYGRFPSSYPIDNIISVAAIDEREQLAKFSNTGKKRST